MTTRRTSLVYALLIGALALIAVWQTYEHQRVRRSARAALLNRSRDITTTLGLVIRSQRRFGVVSQDRLESALKELVKARELNTQVATNVSKLPRDADLFKSGELSAIALLNASGEVVASAGGPIDVETKGMLQSGEHWDARRVILVNLVDLGSPDSPEGTNNPRTIIMPPRTGPRGPRPENMTNGPGAMWTNLIADATNLAAVSSGFRATNAVGTGLVAGGVIATLGNKGPIPLNTNLAGNLPDQAAIPREAGASNVAMFPPPPGERRTRWRQPPWMTEAEYKSLLETRGLHGAVIAMSTENFQRACSQDLWMRFVIGCFAGLSVGGIGLAYRNIAKTSELQMRLVRASELNNHLKEMNLAAAGLAHETRNPLNIIRGLAQLVSKQDDAAPEIRKRLREIVDETDRVTAQLNEFINYSRPREVRRSVVTLGSVISEVARALSYDVEEKHIRLETSVNGLAIEADEQLLRQCLFNLLLNATQAVGEHGEIRVVASKSETNDAMIEVMDDGPGVPEHQRKEIFKPYFTTHEKGTGLGLAIVQQIVLAHGWEIHYEPNEPRGAIFRLTHLKVVNKS
jgi:signal transduction histidine kinase